MKKIVALMAAFAVFASAGLALAAEDREIVIIEEQKLPYEFNTWLVKTVCADGYVFLVSYALGRTSGAGVHAVQVMEEKDGKMLPKKCDAEKIKKENAKKGGE